MTSMMSREESTEVCREEREQGVKVRDIKSTSKKVRKHLPGTFDLMETGRGKQANTWAGCGEKGAKHSISGCRFLPRSQR
jgi:hypothetical protein